MALDANLAVTHAHTELVQDKLRHDGRIKEKFDSNGDRRLEIAMSCEWLAVDVQDPQWSERQVRFHYFWNLFTNRAQVQVPEGFMKL